MDKRNIILLLVSGFLLGLSVQGYYDSFKHKKETVLCKNIHEYEESFKRNRNRPFNVDTYEPDSIGIYYPEMNCILIIK